MTNPGPRPALRKAPDANVHPALAFGPDETIDLRTTRLTHRVEPPAHPPVESSQADPISDTAAAEPAAKTRRVSDSEETPSPATSGPAGESTGAHGQAERSGKSNGKSKRNGKATSRKAKSRDNEPEQKEKAGKKTAGSRGTSKQKDKPQVSAKATSKPAGSTPRKAPKAKSSRPKSARAKSDRPGKKGAKDGGRVAVRLAVPADVRHQLRSAAKARGTSVDDVVSSVLEGWLPS